MNEVNLSKIISHALRHEPEIYGLILSKDGWVNIESLVVAIKKTNEEFKNLTIDDIARIVNSATKKRHEIKEGQIRALYGHSLEIQSNYVNIEPPEYLYHGTCYQSYLLIKEEGLKMMGREYVHLSSNLKDSEIVARRKSDSITILQIQAKEAFNNGNTFYKEGEVWLTKYILPVYISIIEL